MFAIESVVRNVGVLGPLWWLVAVVSSAKDMETTSVLVCQAVLKREYVATSKVRDEILWVCELFWNFVFFLVNYATTAEHSEPLHGIIGSILYAQFSWLSKTRAILSQLWLFAILLDIITLALLWMRSSRYVGRPIGTLLSFCRTCLAWCCIVRRLTCHVTPCATYCRM